MKILSLVFPGFTFIDLAGPMQALSLLPDMELELAWKTRGPVLPDAGPVVQATHAFDDSCADPDLLLVPGNTKALFRLLHDQETAEFLADPGPRAGWVTSVCSGSLLLGTAGLLHGYRAACFWYARDLLANYGAIPQADRVVVDRNRITGGGMTAGVDFGLTVLGLIMGEDVGRTTELLFEYAPQPPFGTGRRELADDRTLARASDVLSEFMPLATAPAAPLVAPAEPANP